MAIEEGLSAALETVTGLSGRVFPLNAPENQSAPYLVYFQVNGAEYDALDGLTGSNKADYEINVLHSSYKRMKELSAPVIVKLKSMLGATIAGILVQDITVDENSPEIYESQVGLYRKIINVTINY